ncbi:MAG TPA: BolA family protein [Caulobacteraceae bacterium]|jgi:BolA protein|nr:BolA family protein [Caulobacteraceae bacterium]
MGPIAQAMRARLKAAFSPLRLDLVDDSARHAGHAHAGVESHFTLTIEAAAFSGLGRMERQRRVMSVLAEELAGPVHALSIRALAPGEG